jgi:Cu+-exporting ATPase
MAAEERRLASTRTTTGSGNAIAGDASRPNAAGDHVGDDAHSRESGEAEHEHGLEWTDLARIAFVAVAIVALWLKVWEPFPRVSIIGIGATLIGIYPILREAMAALFEKRMTMELSMSIAIFAALAIGQFLTALVIVLFVLIAEVLEGLTVGRGRRAIKDLLDFMPQRALVRREGSAEEVNAVDIQIGDIVVVKPGSRIPVDGVVERGNSFVDQATITGESLPVEKVSGSNVYAGTINQSGALDIRVAGVGRDTAFGKIVQAVEAAEKSRAPIQKTADRLAGYLVYFAAGCAVLTFAVTRDLKSTISVIIVAGACGIAAGTPLAILGAIGQAARRGAIVKGGRYLEILKGIDTVVLDKTGTLTYGDPRIVGILPAPGATIEAVLRTAATAERPSEHPLGKAIIKKLSEANLTASEPDRFYYIPGKGVVCVDGGDEIVVGNKALLDEWKIDVPPFEDGSGHSSVIFVARKKQFLGMIRIADEPRPEALQAISELKRLGIKTILLTGDAEPVARDIAGKLGIDDFMADMLPEQKSARIKTLAYTGSKVAMVGDGINDAPALMEASVGIAMGSGTDIAQECGDVILLGDDLLKLVDLLRISRRCYSIIMFNFAGTLLVDSIGVGLAAFGMLNPLLAAFIHVASEMAFILNSARLLPAKRSKTATIE